MAVVHAPALYVYLNLVRVVLTSTLDLAWIAERKLLKPNANTNK